MKKVINTYQSKEGGVFSVEAGTGGDKNMAGIPYYTLIGTEEREFNLPKKMVTRVVYPTNIARSQNWNGFGSAELEVSIPIAAKNLRVTYDIEETLPT